MEQMGKGKVLGSTGNPDLFWGMERQMEHHMILLVSRETAEVQALMSPLNLVGGVAEHGFEAICSCIRHALCQAWNQVPTEPSPGLGSLDGHSVVSRGRDLHPFCLHPPVTPSLIVTYAPSSGSIFHLNLPRP